MKSLLHFLKKAYSIFNKKQRKDFMVLIFFIFVSSLMELICIPAILPFVNLISNSNDSFFLIRFFNLNTSKSIMIFCLTLILLAYLFKNICLLIMYKVQFSFARNVRLELMIRLVHIYINKNYLFHKNSNLAAIQRDIDSDTMNYYNLVNTIAMWLTEIMVSAFIGIFLLITNTFVTIIVGLILVIFLGLFVVVYRKKLKYYGEVGRISYSSMLNWILQIFNGIKEVKVNNKEMYFEYKFEQAATYYLDNLKKQNYFVNLPKLAIETIGVFAMLVATIIQTMYNGDFSSTISTIAMFVAAAFRLIPSFNRMSNYITTITYYSSSLDAIIKNISNENINSENYLENFISFNNDICIKNVSFKYDERSILKNINLKINKNTSVALIGPSGMGKSTLADILLALIPPNSGSISVDGIDINDNLINWRNMIGYIPQDVYLFNDTVKANIAFGVRENEIDYALLQEVIEKSQLSGFINGLPDGINTNLGENGSKISGGQKQRIGIARALYKNPDILILDEATSALDNETELSIMNEIYKFKKDLTLIIIAHRLSTIKNCDYIYEVNNAGVRLICGKERDDLFKQ